VGVFAAARARRAGRHSDVACDFRQRVDEDSRAHAARVGRTPFSRMGRIRPTGRGQFDESALEHYRAELDCSFGLA